MLLAYNPDRTATRDIDAVFTPDDPMVDAVRETAVENGWPTTWLNNQAAMYAARQPGQGTPGYSITRIYRSSRHHQNICSQ